MLRYMSRIIISTVPKRRSRWQSCREDHTAKEGSWGLLPFILESKLLLVCFNSQTLSMRTPARPIECARSSLRDLTQSVFLYHSMLAKKSTCCRLRCMLQQLAPRGRFARLTSVSGPDKGNQGDFPKTLQYTLAISPPQG